jgi:hypothetical protein
MGISRGFRRSPAPAGIASCKSLDSHLIRTLLAARPRLVAMHRDVANQIRGALKTFGPT